VVSRNRKLGFFTISFNDLTVPMPGLPIQIVRTYDSRQKDIVGDFGPGWALSLANIRLQKTARSVTSGRDGGRIVVPGAVLRTVAQRPIRDRHVPRRQGL